MAKMYLFEAQRRSKSGYKHQRDFAQWLLNAAIRRTNQAISEHIGSKNPAGQLEIAA
jgi:hypothetical protein